MQRPQIGDRVRITGIMPDDPAPLPVGLEGIVTDVTPPEWQYQQYSVDWEPYYEPEFGEQRRTLMLLPHDPFIIVSRAAAPTQPSNCS